jgi:uncharacterized protein YhhL (DUF1145 family)
MVMCGGVRLIIFGAALGVTGAIKASQALRSMLFGITSLAKRTFLAALTGST